GGYGGGSWINTDVSLQLNATDNGTGVKSITYAATGAQPITQATVNNTPVSGAQSVTVPTLTTEGTTTVTYHATDNSKTANVENDKTFVAMIDKHNPTASITFPANNTPYTTASWNAGCSTSGGDTCGTAADTGGSGVSKVEVAFQQQSTGKYWDGSGFGTTPQTWFTATGTTSWSYPFAGSNFTDGTYVELVKV